nr:MAG TPA: hypothetical protein [Caudoviricetes sp.]
MRAIKNYIPRLREKVLHFYSNIIISHKTSKAYFLYPNLSQGGYFLWPKNEPMGATKYQR